MLHGLLQGENLFDFYEKLNKFRTSQKHYIIPNKLAIKQNNHAHSSQQACGQRRALWPSSPLPLCLQPPEGSLAAVRLTCEVRQRLWPTQART
jgi:hypothetical protein